MSYGLYDADLSYYARVPFYNLELMKLSSYYKRKRQIVSLSPTLSPQKYSHFIIRQDYPHELNTIPIDINEITFGGRVFDGKVYKPLPLDIEGTPPDVSLYDRVDYEFKIPDHIRSSFSILRRAEHVRLSLDGKTIWSDFEKQLRHASNTFGLICYDYNLGNVEGAREFITDLLPEITNYPNGRRIGMKFPVITTDPQEHISWLKIQPLNQFYSLQYNGLPTLDEVKEFVETSYHSTAYEQSTINVTAGTTYEKFITSDISTLFDLILDLRMHYIYLPLIYDRDFFVDYRWLQLMEYFQTFANYIKEKLRSKDYRIRVLPYESFYSYMRNQVNIYDIYKQGWPREQVSEVFQFVRENNYDLFKKFYEYTGEKK